MTAKSLLQVASWLFLAVGVTGAAISVALFLSGGTPANYGAAAIGGTFWLICAAVSFFLRSRLS